MSIEELLKLRDEVGRALSQKAVQLEQQLARLGGEVRTERRGRGGSDMLRARAEHIQVSATTSAAQGKCLASTSTATHRRSRRLHDAALRDFDPAYVADGSGASD